MPRPNDLALLAAVMLAGGAPCVRASGTAPAAAPMPAAAAGTENALLADFVELPASRTMRRDAALVELVNMSTLTLDVSFGPGSASLDPKQRMLAGVQPGDVAVKVTGRNVAATPLQGDLHIEGGRHYELAFAYGPGPAADATSVLAPTAGVTAPAGTAPAVIVPAIAPPSSVAPAADPAASHRDRRL